MSNSRIKSAFAFLSVVAPAVTAATTAKAPSEKKRSDERANVLHVYGPVTVDGDGVWNVAAINIVAPASAAKYNPYILLSRETIPAVGTTYALPFAWDGCFYVSRKKAVRLAHAFNLAFKS